MYIFIWYNSSEKPAVVVDWFRACVKFKYTLTQRLRLESPLEITMLITQSQKWLVTIQIVGCRVTCVAYDIEPSVDTASQRNQDY